MLQIHRWFPPLFLNIKIQISEFYKSEASCHPFKSDMGTRQNETKCNIWNVRLTSKTGSIFFKQCLNAMCGRTFTERIIIYQVNVWGGSQHKVACGKHANEANSMLYNTIVGAGEGWYSTLQGRKLHLLTDYSLPWKKHPYKIQCLQPKKMSDLIISQPMVSEMWLTSCSDSL